MPITFKKSYVNGYKFNQYTNSSKDLYNLQMTNIMDAFFDNAMTNVTNGAFKAVVLSGIRTEGPAGEGTDANDGSISNGFVNIVVKPLTPFGDMIPDPRAYTSPVDINYVIGMYASMYTARSDHPFDATNPVAFGQVIDCYFESGNVSNSDFRTLRFSKPVGYTVDKTFEDLATIEGVLSATDADWANCALLGSATAYEAIGAEHLGAADASPNKKFGPGADGELRKAAWQALRPFLPKSTVLTSVYRGQEDQNRIIKNYAIRYGFTGDTTDYTAMHAFIRKKPTPGLVVGRYVGRGHGGKGRTGAFDLSGANLDLIWSAVQAANRGLQGQVKFAQLKQGKGESSIMERSNNCVHVHFELSDVNITVVPGESGPPASDDVVAFADLQTKYSGKTMYFIPGTGARQGSFIIEDKHMFFKYNDDDGVNRKLRVFQ